MLLIGSKPQCFVSHSDEARASADFMISSPLMSSTYQGFSPDYHGYIERMDADQTEQQLEAQIA